jgi:hypothetical protein
MNRIALLAATASVACMAQGLAFGAERHIALTSTGSHPRPISLMAGKTTTLYDQSGNDNGIAIVSQNFESSLDQYDSQGADDFTIPRGQTWIVSEIDVIGQYFNGSGPATSENVTFFKDAKGIPGAQIGPGNDGIVGADSAGSFSIKLVNKVKLKRGRYWVSVVANCNFSAEPVCGEWGWEQSSVVTGDPAQWQNPGDGFGTGCTTWGNEFTCLGIAPHAGDDGVDHLFALKGKVKT